MRTNAKTNGHLRLRPGTVGRMEIEVTAVLPDA